MSKEEEYLVNLAAVFKDFCLVGSVIDGMFFDMTRIKSIEKEAKEVLDKIHSITEKLHDELRSKNQL